MDFFTFLDNHKPRLTKYMASYLDRQILLYHDDPLRRVHRQKQNQDTMDTCLYTDIITRLKQFSTQGKMIRGILVLLSATMGKHTIDTSILKIATAMELTHAALLIHDDIMDKDLQRRGEKTIYAQYIDVSHQYKAADPGHYGMSMGICAGDMVFFLSTDLISRITLPIEIKQDIMSTFNYEIHIVSTAQMTDMHFGLTSDEPSIEEILTMYIQKTARYSFSLPLKLGAIAAGLDKKIVKNLFAFGLNVGIVFQLKDDHIKLFGKDEETGTNIGSDIRENKKTVHRALLYEKVNTAEKEFIDSCFGNDNLNQNNIQKIKDLMQTKGVVDHIQKMMQSYAEKARKLLKNMQSELNPEYKNMLEELVSYNLERTS